jgi:S-methylmethionine-dependent homocysteine/selenocysteine methylase
MNQHRFLTDGGLETVLVFLKDVDLPCFAAFDILSRDWGAPMLEDYYRDYLHLAARHNTCFVLETPTWRPSHGWGEQLGYTSYYMINCAHPTHFEEMLAGAGGWRERVRSLRGNASRCSHAELDEAEELDDGNPAELGEDYKRLKQHLPQLRVYGGCCGTDHRHVGAIASACLS